VVSRPTCAASTTSTGRSSSGRNPAAICSHVSPSRSHSALISSGGRPGFLCEYVQRRATSWRCQRNNVPGFTGKLAQAALAASGSAPPTVLDQPASALATSLTAQDRQLVAQQQDLQLLRPTRPRQQPHQREQVPKNEIHKRPEQALPSTTAKRAETSAPEARGAPRTSLRTLRAPKSITCAGDTASGALRTGDELPPTREEGAGPKGPRANPGRRLRLRRRARAACGALKPWADDFARFYTHGVEGSVCFGQ
jgi:hypothetical protein